MNQEPADQSLSSTTKDSPSLPRTVRLLGVASLLNDVASEMIFPLLPTFVITVLGGSQTTLGLIEGSADSLSSLLKLGSGYWSDRLGNRRRFVFWGYAIAALIRPTIAMMTAPWQIGVARLVDRFGKGVRSAPRDAMIADSSAPSERGRAFGFHRAMDHAGAAIGPLLATTFLWFWPGQLRTLFTLALLPGLVLLALLYFGLPNASEKPSRSPEDSPTATWSLKSFDFRFCGFLVALLLFTLGNASDAFLLVRAATLGVPAALLPVLWCVFHMEKSFLSLKLGAAVDRIGARSMISIGWAWYAVIYVLFALSTEAWHAWVLFLLYAPFYAFTEAAQKALVAELVPVEKRGLAYGWFNATVGIGALPASLMFGALSDHFGPATSFSAGAVLAVLATLLLQAVTHSPRPARQS